MAGRSAPVPAGHVAAGRGLGRGTPAAGTEGAVAAVAAAGSIPESGPVGAPLLGTAPRALSGASLPAGGPVAALHLARQMLQLRRDKAGATHAFAAGPGSGPQAHGSLAATMQWPMRQAGARARRSPGEYRGWCRSLNVSVKVSDHGGTFEEYSTRLVGVAPRLVGHAMTLPAAWAGAAAAAVAGAGAAAGGGAAGSAASCAHAPPVAPQPTRMDKGSGALVRAACVRGCTLLLTWSRVLVAQPGGAAGGGGGGGGAPAAAAHGGPAAVQPLPQPQPLPEPQPQQAAALADRNGAAPPAAREQGAAGLAHSPAPTAAADAAAAGGAGQCTDAPAALLAITSSGPPSVGSVQAQVGSTLVRWARQTDREQEAAAAAAQRSRAGAGAAPAAGAAGSGSVTALAAPRGAARVASVEGGGALSDGPEGQAGGRLAEMLPMAEVVRLVHVSPPALALPAGHRGDGAAAGPGGGAAAAPQPARVRLCVVSAGPLRARVLVLAAAAAAAEARAGGVATTSGSSGMMTAAVLKEVPVELLSGVQDIELDLSDVVQGLADDAVAPAAGPGGGSPLRAFSLQLVLAAPHHAEEEGAAAAGTAGEQLGTAWRQAGSEGASGSSPPVQQQPQAQAQEQVAPRGRNSLRMDAGASAADATGCELVHAGGPDNGDGVAVDGQAGEWAVVGSEDDGSDMGSAFADGGEDEHSLHVHAHALMQQLPSESAASPLLTAARAEPPQSQPGSGAGSRSVPTPTMAALTATGGRVEIRGGAASPAAPASAASSQAAASAHMGVLGDPDAAAAAAAAEAQPLVHFFAPLLVLPADAAAEVNELWATFSGAAAAPLGELQDAVHAAAADIAEMLVDVSAEAFARRLAGSSGSGGGIMGTHDSSFSLASSSGRSEDDGGGGGAGGGWRSGARRRLAPHLDVGPGAAAAAAAVAAGAAAEADLGGAELRAAALGEAWTSDMEPLVEDIAALLELNATWPLADVPAAGRGAAGTAAAAAAGGGGRAAAVDVVGVNDGLVPPGASSDNAQDGCPHASGTCGTGPTVAADDSGSLDVAIRSRTLSSGSINSRGASPTKTSAADAAMNHRRSAAGSDVVAPATGCGFSANSGGFSAAERRLAEGLAASLLPHLHGIAMPATLRLVTVAAVRVLGQPAVGAILPAPVMPAAPAGSSSLPAEAVTAAVPAVALERVDAAGLRKGLHAGMPALSSDAGGACLKSGAAAAEAADMRSHGAFGDGTLKARLEGKQSQAQQQPQQQLQLLQPSLSDDFRVWRVAELLRGAGGRARMCLLIGLAASVQSFAAIARGHESAMKLLLLGLFSLAEVLGNLCIAVGAKVLLPKPPPAQAAACGAALSGAAASGSGAPVRSSSNSGAGSASAIDAGDLGAADNAVLQAQRLAALRVLATVYDWATLVGIPLLLFLCSKRPKGDST
ncbi:hypothetical protein HXX76_007848 [Chlamydomonas incerta]|uniref:Uncharacterized protein n=1 Tax=Chlamydomonas incerta TaxID=51695 RepID=A0A835T9L1_CHLIN|nr:hypothetical protein HXX76_007848 [Chlamydomonas incerta]|eukprot:KAG2434121.1 hypothetical protein HXX76_007848 [Chlamydomonas incerta]